MNTLFKDMTNTQLKLETAVEGSKQEDDDIFFREERHKTDNNNTLWLERQATQGHQTEINPS